MANRFRRDDEIDGIADDRETGSHAECTAIDGAGRPEADPLACSLLRSTSTPRLIGLVTPSIVRLPVTRGMARIDLLDTS